MEFNLYSSFLKNRVDLNFSLYKKSYSSYKHFFILQVGGTVNAFIEDIGKVTKSGYELNGNFHIVQRKALDWIVLLSYSKNSTELIRNEVWLVRADSTINNKISSLINSFRYKNFELNFELESKNGYDINLYRKNIAVAEPISYWLHSQISEVNNNGYPTFKSIDYFSYITDTDYFILKHAGLEYHIRDNAKSNKYVIGLHYNKMRRIYFYLSDIGSYRGQFYQKPSFYSALSLSFKMNF